MKIQCAICGKNFKQIQHRHLNQHDISFEEYIARFPGSPTCCEETKLIRSKGNKGKTRSEQTRKRMSESITASWQNNPLQGRTGHPLPEESKRKLSAKLMNHPVSIETRLKIGLSGLGREPWNKGLTKILILG